MVTPSEVVYIRRCVSLARKAITCNKYDLAQKLLLKVPGAIGAKMQLLSIEHEVGYRRSMGEVVQTTPEYFDQSGCLPESHI